MKIKNQKSKIKISVQNLKFLIFTLSFCTLIFTFFTFTHNVHAQDSNQLNIKDFNPEGVPQDPPTFPGVTLPGDNEWVKDRDVTFAGKLASRSQDVLNWVLSNYKWAENGSHFQQVWINVRNTVYALLSLLILAAAFLLIITRGKSLTIRKFIPTFVLILILITLSFSLVQFLYQITDITQGFFLRRDGKVIGGENLLNIGFNYQDFEGLKLYGRQYTESVFVSTWLVKITAITYYIMSAVLLLRKVILWFFLIVSPVFPLLFLLPALRNSGKIWLGEFLRWLLYGPLFSILLAGLVAIWTVAIPLDFKCYPGTDTSSGPKYPTAINIVLGGPCQQVSKENSLNSRDTFIQYVVALLMLWAIVVLPFILLKIFLNYFKNYSLTESNIVKYLAATAPPVWSSKYKTEATHPTEVTNSLPSYQHSNITDLERSMQVSANKNISASQDGHLGQTMPNLNFSKTPLSPTPPTLSVGQESLAANPVIIQPESKELLATTNLTIPKISDVAHLEASTISPGSIYSEKAAQITEGLRRLNGDSPITTATEKTHFSELKEKIIQKSQSGDAVANSILSASMPATEANIPEFNQVQQVSPLEFEEVKNTWRENYLKLQPPTGPDNKPLSRKEWLTNDVHRIPEVIDDLLSGEADRIKQAKEALSKILPFLLLGGFSKSEIVAYLKAKLEAAKEVLAELLQIGKEPTDQ